MVHFFGQFMAVLALSGSFIALGVIPNLGGLARAEDSEAASERSDTTSDDVETADTTEAAENPRFACQVHDGQYTVMYSPESEPVQAYPWAVPGDMGSNWPAQRRCDEISARLESYRPDGLLELQTGVENGYNVVCVTTETVANCRIVFTVPEGQDPTATRDQVFNHLTLADAGERTQGVNTFTGRESQVIDQIESIPGSPPTTFPAEPTGNGINLKPFLAPADGGTGTRLTNGAATDRSLNPDRFR